MWRLGEKACSSSSSRGLRRTRQCTTPARRALCREAPSGVRTVCDDGSGGVLLLASWRPVVWLVGGAEVDVMGAGGGKI